MKNKLLCAGLAIFTYLMVFSIILSRREVSHEIISPIPTATPTCSPTPTRLPKYEEVSWYGQEYCRKYNPACLTSCGERFSESDFTAACSSKYSCGDNLRITYGDKSIVVRCNDSGSFKEKYSRELDLSRGAFEALSPLSAGVIEVEIKKVEK